MQNIGVAGIVAEYNPFHLGHAAMIGALRAKGAHTVVCVMSGPFVQRAEPAYFSTFVRAGAAIAGGVDLVLRLPVPYAAASAEGFGAGGAGLLSAIGCVDALCFGAEEADVTLLQAIARMLVSPAFAAELKVQLAKGISFAAARMQAAEICLPGSGAVLQTPNNILAVEYCKALQSTVPQALCQLAAPKAGAVCPALPQPFAVARVGAAHDGQPQKGVASASWLRAKAAQEGVFGLAPWVPDACLPFYTAAAAKGEQRDAARWEMALLARLRGCGASFFAPYTGGRHEGLDARLAIAAQAALSLEQLYAKAKSKRFAHSRVRRAALAAALRLPVKVPAVPPFAQVLAANEKGLALLRKAKHTSLVPLSTSLAKLSRGGREAGEIVRAEAQAEDLYALCQAVPHAGGRAFTQAAYFEKR